MSTANRVALVGLLVGLVACGGGPGDPSGAGHQLSDAIHLGSAKVISGQPIRGSVVIFNAGGPVNLSHGCRPGYAVILTNSHFPPQVVWPANCVAGPFVIGHGTTNLPITVATTYSACAQVGGSVTPRTPPCLADEPPPLPPGAYEAVLEWGGTVPLPAPPPVAVTLLAS